MRNIAIAKAYHLILVSPDWPQSLEVLFNLRSSASCHLQHQVSERRHNYLDSVTYTIGTANL